MNKERNIISLPVDTYASFEDNGITVTTYIGDVDEPQTVVQIPFEDLIDFEFETNVIRRDGEEVIAAYREDYDDGDGLESASITQMRNIIRQLRVAADVFEDRLNRTRVLDRRTNQVRDMTEQDM
jgi:hypothetical protein